MNNRFLINYKGEPGGAAAAACPKKQIPPSLSREGGWGWVNQILHY